MEALLFVLTLILSMFGLVVCLIYCLLELERGRRARAAWYGFCVVCSIVSFVFLSLSIW